MFLSFLLSSVKVAYIGLEVAVYCSFHILYILYMVLARLKRMCITCVMKEIINLIPPHIPVLSEVCEVLIYCMHVSEVFLSA